MKVLETNINDLVDNLTNHSSRRRASLLHLLAGMQYIQALGRLERQLQVVHAAYAHLTEGTLSTDLVSNSDLTEAILGTRSQLPSRLTLPKLDSK